MGDDNMFGMLGGMLQASAAFYAAIQPDRKSYRVTVDEHETDSLERKHVWCAESTYSTLKVDGVAISDSKYRNISQNCLDELNSTRKRWVLLHAISYRELTQKEISEHRHTFKDSFDKGITHECIGRFEVFDTVEKKIVYIGEWGSKMSEYPYIWGNILDMKGVGYIYIPTGEIVLKKGLDKETGIEVANYDVKHLDNALVFTAYSKENVVCQRQQFIIILDLVTGDVQYIDYFNKH